MIIVNQDRTKRIHFNKNEDTLETFPVMSEDILMGINLMVNNELLGTFMRVSEAIREINLIHRSNDETYEISVY